MANLSEKIIQDTAQAFLYKRYYNKARKGRVFSRTEVRTRQKFGGKRADGLLAFQHYLWGTYVISMEAKSFKTLSSMKPKRDDNLLVWNSVKAGLKFCVISGMFFALYRMDDGFLQFILPLNMFVCGAIIFGFFTLHSYRHKKVNVIRQLAQYPANERWLAFSKDSLDLLEKDKLNALDKICKFKGIGIIVVSRKGRAKVKRSASMRWKWFGDFLTYYSHEKRIREAIQ